MKHLSIIKLSALLVCLVVITSCTAEKADLILVNGTIYTMDEDKPVADALAIRGNTILFVGGHDEVMDYASRRTTVIDLDGKTVIPGLTESHMHFDNLGRNILTAPLDVYWVSLDELRSRISTAVSQAEPGEWIVARGYNDALWDVPAHRSLLDDISPENPVVLRRYCGHAHFVNSRALEAAGVDRQTPSPDAGTIVHDQNGNPSGVLVSAAGMLVTRHVPSTPALTQQEEMEALKLGSDALLANGITTVHCASGIGLEEVNLRKKAYEEGYLNVRIMDAIAAEAARELGSPLVGLYNDRYSVRWVKMFVDGSLGGRGAALLNVYDDMPGEYGALRALGQDEEAYAQLVADLLQLGFTTRTHSIGDRGNRMTLNAFEKAMELSGKTPFQARLVVEHAQVLHPEDIKRFADRNVIASMQPVHATEDMLFVEDRLGFERAKGAYAWRSILDHGGIISAGSDYGVSPFNPFYGLHAAVTRQDRENNPAGGWFPEQVMSRQEALLAYTVWPAYVEFAEDYKGKIKKGMLADLVVIDRDYFQMPAEDIHQLQVEKTILGGKIAYKRDL